MINACILFVRDVLRVHERSLSFLIAVKPGFHMSGKSQTIGDFTLPSIPDFADISDIRPRSVPDFTDFTRVFERRHVYL